MKITMSFGKPQPEGVEISDEKLKELVASSRWCPGEALLGEHKVVCQRMKTLDGYIYRINGQIVEHVDAFIAHEYIPWRDGEIPENQI